jgi:hypothetical protein
MAKAFPRFPFHFARSSSKPLERWNKHHVSLPKNLSFASPQTSPDLSCLGTAG